MPTFFFFFLNSPSAQGGFWIESGANLPAFITGKVLGYYMNHRNWKKVVQFQRLKQFEFSFACDIDLIKE